MTLLDIRGPQLHRCQVYRYFSGLSRLYLSVFKPHQTVPAFYVLFSDVGYFEGPMSWQSADFQLASSEDCVALMLKVGIIGPAVLQFPDAYASITEAARLYVVDTGFSRIQIIAGSLTLLNDIPAAL